MALETTTLPIKQHSLIEKKHSLNKNNPYFIKTYLLLLSKTSITRSDPTVKPPSLIAKLSPLDIGTLFIKETSISAISPGMASASVDGNLNVTVMSAVLI